jgi:hypothetical protein
MDRAATGVLMRHARANDGVSGAKQMNGVAWLGSKVRGTPRNEVTACRGESDATVMRPVAD